MDRILNVRTNTLHKPRTDTSEQRTECGALLHVPRDHVEEVSGADFETTAAVSQCGRCFEDGGGY
ncbi:hypothetical protein OB955_18730 [Halobacteria archaeon AArc-m2/3/4]|uniref:Uncharacterized protein n=1 Tax=Natronoglomus mannanivorans TaxID=2979990 RepID=A0AAP3E3B5_9EURY|nr:hypothetical protein [Halobacteria archaeon AArc-xg1-1]MCU4974759.1 hypothetical protein [Halobacteria archaeon AArc-m2/3/4]